MKEQTFEEIKQERDALLSIVGGSQRRAAELELTLQLLILGGDVTETRVAEAQQFAAKSKTTQK